MKKHIIFALALLTSYCAKSQMLITDDTTTQDMSIHPSAILELRSNNKGLLVPRIDMSTTTLQNPIEGQLIYDTNSQRLMNYAGSTSGWIKNIEMSDSAGLIKTTKNYIARSTSPVDHTVFPTTIPTFTIGSSTSGWVDLNTTLTITPTQDNNTVLINVEGMVQPNNTSTGTAFSYAIGLFVNGQLRIVRKYDRESSGSCSWNKFDLTGVFYNLPKNAVQTIKVYGRNLRRGSASAMTRITYGGNANNCNNLTQSTAQILLAAQLTE